ncbi:MAG: DEAD/DEAH box helicase [Elusimicrobiota bacterium]|jgi:ATP-dependent RNA helicase DeaD|nr:DEAD/DEAH box helicase [Elusimicrobiota bacterium]
MKKLLFTELGLSNEILKAVKDMGFEEATPIQSLTIPEIIKKNDIIGQAQTGTGKTASFGIPILEMLDEKSKVTQFMILAPTRELAVQISTELKELAKYKKYVSILPVYGGQPIERQIFSLKKGVQVVIGTPGRVLDHLERKTLELNNLKMIVLDEADEMLDMGFIEDIEEILKNTPKNKQTVFFSATISPEFIELTKKYQKDPIFLKVEHEQISVPQIKQSYFELRENGKNELLCRLIDLYQIKLGIVFCNTKKKVDDVVANLQLRGYLADALHGDMSQVKRDSVMARFRKGHTEILVATDVAARGIDIDDLEAVFNFDLPQDEEYYVHRIGRTGRAGKSGYAFSFVSGKDIYKLREIQRYTKTQIQRSIIPKIEEVEEVRMSQFFDKVQSVIDDSDIEKYINLISNMLTKDKDITSLEIAGALLKMYFKGKIDNSQNIEENFSGYGQNNRYQKDIVKLFIGIGRLQNVGVGDILGAIAAECQIDGKLIGKIEVKDNFSFIEVPTHEANNIILKMKDKTIKKNKVKVELANISPVNKNFNTRKYFDKPRFKRV